MAEQVLEQLFDSPVKVKLLKLFLRNPEKYFLMQDVIARTQASERIVKRQVKGLHSIGFLRIKNLRGSASHGTKPGIYFGVNPNFDFYAELQTLVLKSSSTSKSKMAKRLSKVGRIKMALISRVLLNSELGRVDLFLVGDDFRERRLQKFLAELESEVGKEIQYAFMETKEFEYRYQMFDRFVRDIFEKPHEKLINKLGLFS